MTHQELVEIGYRWLLNKASCGIAFKELHSNTPTGEQPDVIGFGSWGHSVLIECKVSRPDYMADHKKRFRKQPHKGMGKFRFYLTPAGLITARELPDNWGLLYADNNKITVAHNPYGAFNQSPFKQNLLAEHGLLYSALRRHEI
ncbi:hypothetical protein Q4E40_02675 [Pontibacter sp. BT731]|uniref:hypothetical protein n=1 Tax=Pontibacter coccineus TaxID=3063328 RepID=UPI0026E2BB7B|nr:hypothetical protein [Pontibacter sp. BT731]MDO6389017.1 hypothetical protein [Pontibacter sp. BT731]